MGHKAFGVSAKRGERCSSPPPLFDWVIAWLVDNHIDSFGIIPPAQNAEIVRISDVSGSDFRKSKRSVIRHGLCVNNGLIPIQERVMKYNDQPDTKEMKADSKVADTRNSSPGYMKASNARSKRDQKNRATGSEKSSRSGSEDDTDACTTKKDKR